MIAIIIIVNQKKQFVWILSSFPPIAQGHIWAAAQRFDRSGLVIRVWEEAKSH